MRPTSRVTMSGIRLGERLLQIGLADGRLLIALAAKIGMSGRSCGVDDRGRGGGPRGGRGHREGVLVELHHLTEGVLPFDDGDFDVVVVNLASPKPRSRCAEKPCACSGPAVAAWSS